ncbi:hypothetical protein SAMN05428988_0213 [Chitinophaga sp. YR573]|nr:hypothetical protein SAMN05428988_0213 [Chitinophaga sp. YR573]
MISGLPATVKARKELSFLFGKSSLSIIIFGSLKIDNPGQKTKS